VVVGVDDERDGNVRVILGAQKLSSLGQPGSSDGGLANE